MKESIQYTLQTELSLKLPKDKKIVVVCFKGKTSAIVSDILKNLGYPSTSLVGGMENWENFYDRRTITSSEKLTIFQVSRPSRGCLSYVVISNCIATAIDPSRHIQLYQDLFQQSRLNPNLF